MNWLDPKQWILIALFCGASVMGFNFWENRLIEQGDAAGYSRAVGEYKALAEKVAADTAAKTAGLQDAADKERTIKNAALHALNLSARALSDSLRNRPDRPASGSGVPAIPVDGAVAAGCTGAGLYRPDGEFLVGEAARSKRLAIALRSCYADYERARSKAAEIMP